MHIYLSLRDTIFPVLHSKISYPYFSIEKGGQKIPILLPHNSYMFETFKYPIPANMWEEIVPVSDTTIWSPYILRTQNEIDNNKNHEKELPSFFPKQEKKNNPVSQRPKI